jgi:hypothetical protein
MSLLVAQSSREIENAEMGCGFLFWACHNDVTVTRGWKKWLRKVLEKSKTRKWGAVFWACHKDVTATLGWKKL